MILHYALSATVLLAFATCDSPYKKKDDEEKKVMKDQSHEQNFQAFLGRLRIAVAKKDTVMMASMMTPDFGYRWDDGPPGETPFMYWDQHHLWGELSNLLTQPFAPSEMYMVAPPQVISDPAYTGYRVGARTIRGSWKLAYFVSGDAPH